MARKRGAHEVVDRNLTTKTVYRYTNPEKNVDVKSREVFKRARREVHYPFNPNTGKQKYKTITTIVYEGLPATLPAGFLKAPRTGFGFTRETSPLLYAIQRSIPSVRTIVVSSDEPTVLISRAKLRLSLRDITNARPLLMTIQDRHKDEIGSAANNILAELIPSKFKSTKMQNKPGQLAEFLRLRSIKPSQLSAEDVSSAASLVASIPSTHPLAGAKSAIDAKLAFDRLLVTELLERYESLLCLKSDTPALESRWQEFFSENLLYFNFGYVHRFEKELVQGDKTLNIPDFIMLSSFGYLDVFEIKTHLTQLLSYDVGRRNFYWRSDAAKALSQAENYIDSLAKEENTVIKNIRDEYGVAVDAVRPFAYVIASSRSTIAGAGTGEKYRGRVAKKLWNDFRRLNTSAHNVRFVLYDELLTTFKTMLKRLGADEGKSAQ
jgi:hypothetical protein